MKSYRVRERLHEDLLPHLLLARGIEPLNHEAFLNPDFLRDSHDPYLLPDMAAAVERLQSAAAKGEGVAVWSDYDCDGIPGGVLLTEFLREWGLSVIHYIPHRHKEGYGLNTQGLDDLKAQGVSLVITVDLGTTNHQEIAYAKKIGIDTIVTDHHLVLPGEPLPDALVINPKRPDSKYPFDGLCGAGMAWKLVQALLMKDRKNIPDGREKWLLDLVALGTLSDMVPLVDENRMLARFGLMVLRRGRRPGLAELLKLLRIKPATLTEDDVGFMVSPRINAASRMDSPAVAARLLAATDQDEARDLAMALDKINNERKTVVATTVKEANKRLHGVDLSATPVIVMGSPHWRPGVLGLVANKLMEAYDKPVWLWGKEGGELLRGSCRSNGISVVELMAAAPDAFDHFGGHAASGGFAVAQEKVHELPARLAAAFQMLAAQAPLSTVVELDREMDLAEVGHAQRELLKLAPFGVGFKKPLFIFPNVSVTGMRTFGKAQDHLELALAREDQRLAGISFFSTLDSYTKKVSPGDKADVVGHVELDWRGSPRLRIVDVI